MPDLAGRQAAYRELVRELTNSLKADLLADLKTNDHWRVVNVHNRDLGTRTCGPNTHKLPVWCKKELWPEVAAFLRHYFPFLGDASYILCDGTLVFSLHLAILAPRPARSSTQWVVPTADRAEIPQPPETHIGDYYMQRLWSPPWKPEPSVVVDPRFGMPELRRVVYRALPSEGAGRTRGVRVVQVCSPSCTRHEHEPLPAPERKLTRHDEYFGFTGRDLTPEIMIPEEATYIDPTVEPALAVPFCPTNPRAEHVGRGLIFEEASFEPEDDAEALVSGMTLEEAIASDTTLVSRLRFAHAIHRAVIMAANERIRQEAPEDSEDPPIEFDVVD